MAESNNKKANQGIDRRKFFKSGAVMAGASVLASTIGGNMALGNNSGISSHKKEQSNSSTSDLSRRKLGQNLEVSSIGLGVQNMHRKYSTTIPYRPEMINILQSAYDQGVTFFDCAEAYGPHENERILGEAIQSFRDKVVITSKFGWNIDLETGARLPGLNSKPEHIKLAVEGMLKRLRTDRIDLLY